VKGEVLLRQFQEKLVKNSVSGIVLQQNLLNKSNCNANKENISCPSISSQNPKTVSIIRSLENKGHTLDRVCRSSLKDMPGETDSNVDCEYFQVKRYSYGVECGLETCQSR
jgi:hypothetical protein